MSETKLSVNLNKVALLRNQRDIGYPSVVAMAKLVLDAGAHGITIHPRPDERHIRTTDAYALDEFLNNEAIEGVEYNIEGYPTDDFMALVKELKPTQVTLVPDAPDQRTSDHGWDIETDREFLQPIVSELKAGGMRVALFVDPEPSSIVGARSVGSDRIELYTEPYAVAHGGDGFDDMLARYVACAIQAGELGLGVNAGHDLNLSNLPAFAAAIDNLEEVSIGHAITADALRIGFPEAVRRYLEALR